MITLNTNLNEKSLLSFKKKKNKYEKLQEIVIFSENSEKFSGVVFLQPISR